MKRVCLVIGAGAGIGGNVARRFAQEGDHACLGRRSDLDALPSDGRKLTVLSGTLGAGVAATFDAVKGQLMKPKRFVTHAPRHAPLCIGDRADGRPWDRAVHLHVCKSSRRSSKSALKESALDSFICVADRVRRIALRSKFQRRPGSSLILTVASSPEYKTYTGFDRS
jgi:NAD(P)-dependent dehydrogenase (short-subunit alcohol dehydrogenase family)